MTLMNLVYQASSVLVKPGYCISAYCIYVIAMNETDLTYLCYSRNRTYILNMLVVLISARLISTTSLDITRILYFLSLCQEQLQSSPLNSLHLGFSRIRYSLSLLRYSTISYSRIAHILSPHTQLSDLGDIENISHTSLSLDESLSLGLFVLLC